ncbi:glycosyltransferase family 2 protein [Pantanalinema sp. GBBB05]|uniref:glycosyltransferase family 2 protein n=1 Tax=Pantanalinema sp. GBBB05 TaxID=2604139 RepID=UPI001E0783D4|nr:glycosyltransferase family 2 protein [Pantanalinema sp. GBBB05]
MMTVLTMSLPVSILIPCFNASPHLADCLYSAVKQDAAEIILLDDASTDDSLAIARSFPEVTIKTHSTNQGVQRCRNELFSLSTQPWIQYLDADDALNEGKIRHQIDLATDADDVLYCDFTIERWLIDTIKIDTWYTGTQPFLRNLARWENLCQTNAFLFRREALELAQWNISPTYEPGHHEHKLCLDLLKAGATFKHTPIIGYTYRRGWHDGQITAQKLAARLQGRAALLGEMEAWLSEDYPGQYDEDIALGRRKLEAAIARA